MRLTDDHRAGLLHVTGGFGGITVRTEDLLAAADRIAALATTLDEFQHDGQAIAGSLDAPGCWVLDPHGHHAAHDAVHDAISGDGLGGLAHDLDRKAQALRVVARDYAGADRSGASLLGRVSQVVTGAGLLTLFGAGAGGAKLLELAGLPVGLVSGLGDWSRDQALDVLARNDLLAEAISAGIPDVLGAVSGNERLATGAAVAGEVQGWSRILGRWLDGHPWFVDGGTGQAVLRPAASVTPPATLAALLAQMPRSSGTDPEIAIERVDRGGGHHWIVTIPGTAGWPTSSGPNPVDGSGAIALAAGQRTAAVDAVEKAMRQAGIGPGEPILLAGHSQGGMIAAAVASDPAVAGQYDVTHLVTVGAPIGAAPIPGSVQVLSIEHREDLVVKADGIRNPDRDTWTTVTAAALGPGDDPMGAHDLGRYIQTAAVADVSADPSIRAWKDSASGFLPGPGDPPATAQRWTAQLTRATPPS